MSAWFERWERPVGEVVVSDGKSGGDTGGWGDAVGVCFAHGNGVAGWAMAGHKRQWSALFLVGQPVTHFQLIKSFINIQS
jgi:hypothetical protein